MWRLSLPPTPVDRAAESPSNSCRSYFILVPKLMLAIFLERTTKKDTTNFSKPASQTGKDESALGRGNTYNKAAAKNRRNVETVTLSKTHACDICGEYLIDVPCVHVERRTKIDIVFEKDRGLMSFWSLRCFRILGRFGYILVQTGDSDCIKSWLKIEQQGLDINSTAFLHLAYTHKNRHLVPR
ncbi:MAG: hypothetical protein IBX56_06965 [Methylomicrobium sp.]|nr:hypothetical protein [Methylomicrobium sp.]